jgi:hypothetical protein
MLFGQSGVRRVATMAIVFSILSACATTAPNDEWSPGVASRTRTIAIAEIAEPAIDLVLNKGRDNESHSSSYAQTLAAAQISFSPLLTEAITRQLERYNYEVLPLADPRLAAAADGSTASSGTQPDADAILVARFIEAGYASDSTSELQPLAVIEVQLLDSRSRRVLYAKTFNGGYDIGGNGLVHLATQARFRFESPGQLSDQIDDSAGGIKDAELAIASALGRDFAIGSRPVVSDSTMADAAPPPPVSAAERDQQTAAALAAQWTEAMPAAAPQAASPASDAVPEAAATTADVASGADTAAMTTDTAVTSSGAEAPAPVADPTPAIPVTEAVQQPATTAAAAITERETPSPMTADSPAAVAEPVAAGPAHEPMAGAPAAAAGPDAANAVTPQDGTMVSVQYRTLLRASPTTQAAVVTVLPAGATATRDARVINNASGSWCYITSATAAGWVPTDAVAH